MRVLTLNLIPNIVNNEIPVITGLNWGTSAPRRRQNLFAWERESEIN
jgi:hypothetical protein